MSAGGAAPGSRRLEDPAAQALLVGLGLFALYALGACRTIYVGDSGELVAAVDLLGIPHPSGYPLYVLLGKLWTLLVPLGSIAWRMSLFSAATAAGACAVTYWLGRRLDLSAPAALFSALVLGLGPSFWSQANIQRVYSLNALALAAALAALVSWHRSRRDGLLVLAVFLAALGAANHTFMGAFGLALVVWAAAVRPDVLRRPGLVAAVAVAGLAGLSVYLYMPIRSRMDPPLDWGNPESLGALAAAVTRRYAWERAWLEHPSDLLAIAGDYLRGIGDELLWVGLPLALVGLLLARRRGWPLALLLAAAAVNFSTMALHGSRSDLFYWHRYYIPTYLVAALLAGLGVEELAVRLGSWRGRALRALVLLLPVALLVLGYPKFDRSRFRLADDFSRTLLEAMPPGAHLSASDDNILFVLIYLHLVERVRPDVDLILQGVGDADLPPLAFDPEDDPLYFTHHPNWRVPGIEVVPVGLVFRTLRSGSPDPEPVLSRKFLDKELLDGERDPRVPRDYLTGNLVGHFHYMRGVTFERRDWPRAELEFSRAREAAFENDVLFYNLGLIYGRNGLLDRAIASFERSAEINSRWIASSRKARAVERLPELEREAARLARLEGALAPTPPPADPEAAAAFHRALAARLEEAGEILAARGHRLRALEAETALR